ncbi:uncharacterized protein LOC129583032 isoform X2 [Paramacrobiotus metropolitanus]|nr:uncharacterized protein LOC129583032 isoform X2 [Paramacrobiotus metropolitanus]
MSGWVQPYPVTVARSKSAGMVVVPAASTVVLGYLATVTTILLTALLGISLWYLVSANRNWMSPVLKRHLWRCRGEVAFAHHHKSSPLAGGILHDYITVLPQVLTSAVIFVVFYASWVVVSVLPVMLAWMSVILAVAIFGPSAVFPGCILFAVLLTAYCNGRIWGLWMNDTYFALMKKAVRMLTTAKSTVKPFSDDPSQEKAFVSAKSSLDEQWNSIIYSLLSFNFGCIAGYYNIWPLYQRFSCDSQAQTETERTNWTCWQRVNTTGICSNYGTRFDQVTAMLSYWVDLQSQELRSQHTANSALLTSFTPSFPLAVGSVLRVWCGVLFAVSSVPFTVLQYAEGITLGIAAVIGAGLLIYACVRACYNKCRRGFPSQRDVETGDRDESQLLSVSVATERKVSVVTADTCTEPSQHPQCGIASKHNAQGCVQHTFKHPMPQTTETTEPFCLCEPLVMAWSGIVVTHGPLVCGCILPYSLGGLFLPEYLQLPGLLLLLTACAIWMYCQLETLAWLMWWGVDNVVKGYRADAGGNGNVLSGLHSSQ